MAKDIWKPGNMLYPLPAVLVTATDGEGNDNVFTVAWTGTVCSFKAMNLTKEEAKYVAAPLIKESPVNIECEVLEITHLGTHDMFLAKVLCVHADEKYMDSKGKFDLAKAAPLVYSHGQYYGVGKKLGRFGFSVRKNKKRK